MFMSCYQWMTGGKLADSCTRDVVALPSVLNRPTFGRQVQTQSDVSKPNNCFENSIVLLKCTDMLLSQKNHLDPFKKIVFFTAKTISCKL